MINDFCYKEDLQTIAQNLNKLEEQIQQPEYSLELAHSNDLDSFKKHLFQLYEQLGLQRQQLITLTHQSYSASIDKVALPAINFALYVMMIWHFYSSPNSYKQDYLVDLLLANTVFFVSREMIRLHEMSTHDTMLKNTCKRFNQLQERLQALHTHTIRSHSLPSISHVNVCSSSCTLFGLGIFFSSYEVKTIPLQQATNTETQRMRMTRISIGKSF